MTYPSGIVLTAAELSQLAGLPWGVICLYVLGIRPRMDMATARVGEKPRISWQALTESLYIEPHQGFKRDPVNKQRVRRMLPHLVKEGLVKNISRERQLIFDLPLARRDSPVPNKADIKPTHQAGRPVPQPQASIREEAEVIAFGRLAQATLSEELEPDIHPLSAIPSSKHHTTTTSISPISPPSGGGDLIWPETLTGEQRRAVKAQFDRAALYGPILQELLDEFEGAVTTVGVQYPQAYMGRLIQRHKRGQFIPEKAYRVRQVRERRMELAEIRSRTAAEAVLDPIAMETGQRVLARIRAKHAQGTGAHDTCAEVKAITRIEAVCENPVNATQEASRDAPPQTPVSPACHANTGSEASR